MDDATLQQTRRPTLYQALTDKRSEIVTLRVVTEAFRALAETGDVEGVLRILRSRQAQAEREDEELTEKARHHSLHDRV